MKLPIVIGLILFLCAFVKCDPTCTYSIIDSKYTCRMTGSIAGASSSIGGSHINGSFTNPNVKVVITDDKADLAIIKLAINTFTTLESLQIQNGEFSTIAQGDFPSSCSTLKHLQISKGTFEAIPDSVFTGCDPEEYNLSNNKIKTVNKGAFTPANVKKLILAGNSLDLSSTIFSSAAFFGSLTHLDLSANSLSSIPSGFNFGSKVITHLDLSKNTLTSFPETQFAEADKISNLYLSGNSITTISASSLSKLLLLKELRIASNAIVGANIEAKAFEKNTNLEVLDMSGNPLVSLDATVFTKLTKLISFDLHSTNLTNTSATALKGIFDTLVTLEYIDISSNLISSIEGIFFKNINLKHLNISGMGLEKLTEETFNATTKLETLRFNNNQITELPEKIFEKTTEMKQINGESNKIGHLKASTFEKMTKLEVLDFSSNAIDKIERTFFDKLTNLKIVKFKGNKCIDKDYENINFDAMKADLKTCFDNNGAATFIISNLLLAFVIALKFI